MSIIRPCDCHDWRENTPKIDSCITIAALHGHAYTGIQFVYCPWCGSCLVPAKCSHQVIKLIHVTDNEAYHVCDVCRHRVTVNG